MSDAIQLVVFRGATTIAQDRESSVVYGMPAEAIELGGASYVLAADKIADVLVTLANRRRATGEKE